MNIYVANWWQVLLVVLGALAVVFLVVTGVCALVNLVAGRRLLRPWMWGGLATVSWLAFLVAYHFVTLYRLRAAP